MKCSEALRKRIDELCKKYNLTYSSLSNKACGNSTISSFMSKPQETLYLPTIYCICLALDISIKEFFDSPCFDQIDEILETRRKILIDENQEKSRKKKKGKGKKEEPDSKE
ncbi:helix-turn-helix domain-containing protein [Holdemania massiliensis]|uniref:helix-turn-helix domain-containing protein n=1 Tax=Holdemania massiliensis TaxID=1468449 RepID=UPI001F059F2F|nr:hypothetical protein [Holdemania massiliensis]MCH1939081.1 hypothetical protein [Holdemania massiliensis]